MCCLHFCNPKDTADALLLRSRGRSFYTNFSILVGVFLAVPIRFGPSSSLLRAIVSFFLAVCLLLLGCVPWQQTECDASKHAHKHSTQTQHTNTAHKHSTPNEARKKKGQHSTHTQTHTTHTTRIYPKESIHHVVPLVHVE